MTAAGPPPTSPPPPGEPPDDAPATVGEVRTLRRWVAVAGVWAVAATAVALIALIDDDAGEQQDAGDNGVAQDIGQLQRSVDERITEIEEQVSDVASADDLQRLDQRLQELEDDVSSASESAAEAADAADALGNRVDDLDARVEALEADAGGGGDGGDQP